MSDPVTTSDPPELKTMRFEVDGPVGTLTLSRPDAMNAMSPEMIAELAEVAPWLADRAPIRALIVTGDGRAFSAGGDVNWFRKGVDDADIDLVQQVRRGADVLHQAIVDFKRIPYPVIAAVNGPAAGAGFSLALMCDIRIASEQAFFVVAYGRIGASPDGGMTYFLPRVIGPAAACELMLEDPNMTAADALGRGLVSAVVEPGELLPAADAKAAELAARSPHYQRMVKRLVWESLDNSLADHLQIERHGIAESMGTEDLKNGVRDFLAGEQPTFHGS
ncbi:MAG: enoyl-CoA hydratase/isomerase family protein [Solirubrobacterales bacterium]|nr:enoyl-CoA hydratase/isomerase family protein [Solirubrobacterales bacterium]